MLYLKYGSYQHDDAEASVAIQRTPIFNEGGQQSGYTESWNITGMLLANSAAEIDSAAAALKSAYLTNGRDLALYFDNGTRTNHYLQSSAARGGTRVTEGVSFPVGDGTEAATCRTYSITVEADFPDTRVPILSWNETLNFEGGGPLYAHLQTLNGLPQKQLLYQATPFRVTQQGEAIGQFTYPIPAAPIWPGALKQAGGFTKKTPKRFGPPGQPKFYEWPITWNYLFESATPLVANPTRWID